jgi:2'-5' RNA ligase
VNHVPEQLSFAEIEPPRLNDRLFFAVFPDAAAAASIEPLARHLRGAHRLTGTLIEKARLHVTLFHIGDYVALPQGVVDAACKAAASVAVPAFDVVFDRVGSFGKSGKRPFVLQGGEGVGALIEFQRALGAALAKAGVASKSGIAGFTPHVTLLYGDREVVTQPIEPIRWKVGEFVLVHSLLGKTRYLPLGRWPLLA